MKKFISVFLCVLLIFVMTACTAKNNKPDNQIINNGVQPNNQNTKTELKGYAVINIDKVPNDVAGWFNSFGNTKGAYIYQHPNNTYIKVVAEDNGVGEYKVIDFIDNDYEKTFKIEYNNTNKKNIAYYIELSSKSIATYKIIVNNTELKNTEKVIKAVINSPKENEAIDNPVEVSGKIAAFEGSFIVRIIDGSGKKLGEQRLQTAGAPTWGSFSGNVGYTKSTAPSGTIELGEYSAKDGTYQKYASVKVRFK